MITIIYGEEKLVKKDFAEARAALSAIAAAAIEKTDVTLLLSEDSYTLCEPFALNAKAEPALKNLNVTICADGGKRPLIQSFVTLSTDKFEKVEGKPYYVYQMEADENGKYPRSCDFYVNDERIDMAKSRQWRNPFALAREERRGEKELEGLYIPPDIAKTLDEGGVGAGQLRMYVQWEHVRTHKTKGFCLARIYPSFGTKPKL